MEHQEEFPAVNIKMEENCCEQIVHQDEQAQIHHQTDVPDKSTLIQSDPINETLIETVPMEKLVGRHILKHILDGCPPLDTIISCSDGKLGAHRAVLVAASPFLGFLLSRRVAGELATIVVPDISLATMTSIMTLIYTGEMGLSTEQEDDVYSAMETLMIGVDADFTLSSRPVQKKPVSPPLPPPLELKPEVPEEAKNEGEIVDGIPPPEMEICDDIEIGSASMSTSSGNRGSTASMSSNSKSAKTMDPPKPKPRGRPYSKGKRGPAKKSAEVKDKNKSTSKSRSCTRSSEGSTTTKRGSNTSKDSPAPEIPAMSASAIKNQNATAKKSFSGIMLEGSDHVCLKCDGILPNKQEFKKHLCYSHGSSLISKEVSSSEMKELLECEICAQKYSSLSRAALCIKGHGFSKCYTCFGLILTEQLAEHYISVHGVRTSFALVARCRWCDLAVDIGKNATKPQSHALSDHIAQTLTAPEGVHGGETVLLKKKDDGKSYKRKRSNGKGPEEEPDCGTGSKGQGSTSGIPFLKQSVSTQEKETLTPTRPPNKKRKLDENGKPLQLSRRTGGVSPLSRKKLFQEKSATNEAEAVLPTQGLPDGMLSTEPPSFVTNPDTGQVVGLSLDKLPLVQVCLDLLAIKEYFLKKNHMVAPMNGSMTGDDLNNKTTGDDLDIDLRKGTKTKKHKMKDNDLQINSNHSSIPSGSNGSNFSTPTTAHPPPLDGIKVKEEAQDDWTSKIILSSVRGSRAKSPIPQPHPHPPPPIKAELPSPSGFTAGEMKVPDPVVAVAVAPSVSTSKKKKVELICIDDDGDEDDEEEGYDFPMLSNNESLVPIFSVNEILGATKPEGDEDDEYGLQDI